MTRNYHNSIPCCTNFIFVNLNPDLMVINFPDRQNELGIFCSCQYGRYNVYTYIYIFLSDRSYWSEVGMRLATWITKYISGTH